MRLEAIKAVGPFGVGSAEPVIHREQAVDPKPRGTALALARASDEAGALQHLQMLGDRRLRHRERRRELNDASVACRELLEDCPASGVGKGRERQAEGIASTHN